MIKYILTLRSFDDVVIQYNVDTEKASLEKASHFSPLDTILAKIELDPGGIVTSVENKLLDFRGEQVSHISDWVSGFELNSEMFPEEGSEQERGFIFFARKGEKLQPGHRPV